VFADAIAHIAHHMRARQTAWFTPEQIRSPEEPIGLLMRCTVFVRIIILACICAWRLPADGALINSDTVFANAYGGTKISIHDEPNRFSGRKFGRMSIGGGPAETVAVNGVLDTDLPGVTYDGVLWTVPGASNSITVEIDNVIPPVCDINGCTPEIIETEEWTITVSFDTFTIGLRDRIFPFPVTSIGPDSAISPITQFDFRGSEVTGTWTIQGPTESAFGDFGIAYRAEIAANPFTGTLDLERTPAGSRPVTGWAPVLNGDFVAMLDPNRTIADGIEVDGQIFYMSTRTIPEPSSLAGGLICAALSFGFLFKRR